MSPVRVTGRGSFTWFNDSESWCIVGVGSRTLAPGVGFARMFKIYIGNLERSVTLDELKTLLASFSDLEDLVLAMDPETGKSRCFAIAMIKDSMRGQLLIETFAGKIHKGRPLVVNEAVKKGKQPLAPKDGIARRPGPGGPRGLGGFQGGASRPFGQRGAGRPSSRPSNRPFNRPQRSDFGGPGGGDARSESSLGSDRGPSRPLGRPGDPVQRLPDAPPSPPRPFVSRASGAPAPTPPSSTPPTPPRSPGSSSASGPLSGRPSSRPGFPVVRRADSAPPSPAVSQPPTQPKPEE
ncbi:MAG: RNA-binding protein [Phycisphaerales bacterium]|nr:RNA-binding protein [Phycisphaerales bacterium]